MSNDIAYMTEESAHWLFGIEGAWIFILSGAVLTVIIAQVKMRVAIDIFIDSLGEKVAKALHADDDHLNLDALLDKLIDPNYQMSYDEWFLLKNRCNGILGDGKISQLERSLAGILAGVCEHKLITKFGKTKTTV